MDLPKPQIWLLRNFYTILDKLHTRKAKPPNSKNLGVCLGKIFNTNKSCLDVLNGFVSLIHKLFVKSLVGVKFTA